MKKIIKMKTEIKDQMKYVWDHIWHEEQHFVTYLLSRYGDESSAHEMIVEQMFCEVIDYMEQRTFLLRYVGGGGTTSRPEE